MSKSKSKPKKDLAEIYAGVEQIDRFRKKMERAPKYQLDATSKDNSVRLWFEGETVTKLATFMESIGTDDPGFLSGFLGQMVNSTCEIRDAPRQERFAFAQAIIQGIEPKDQIEAMLACQMAAIQVCTTLASRRYLLAEHAETRNNAERSLNRLTRTFTTQMEALRKYRTGGKQTVRVERVTVNEGGQAIVGNVEHQGGGSQEE